MLEDVSFSNNRYAPSVLSKMTFCALCPAGYLDEALATFVKPLPRDDTPMI